MRAWVALAVLGTTIAQTANAQYECGTPKPHASLTLTGSETLETAISDGGKYFSSPSGGCFRWRLDVVVEPGGSNQIRLNAGAASLPGGKSLHGGFSAPGSQAACTSYAQITEVYSKGRGATGFTRIAVTSTKATWNGSTCTFTPPSFGPYNSGATYRIAVGVKMSGNWQTVRGTALHIPS